MWTFLGLSLLIGSGLTEFCEEFKNNQVCEITSNTLIDTIDNIKTEELCQIECQMIAACSFFSWIMFSPEHFKESVCYLLTDCSSTEECAYPCTHAVLGPVSPPFSESCCPAFQHDVTCPEDEIIGEPPIVQNPKQCQDFCKNLKDCAFFSFNEIKRGCTFFSSCATLEKCENCFTGPVFPDLEVCVPAEDTAILIGGYNGNYMSSIEVWLPNKPCSNPPYIPDIPIPTSYASAVLGETIMYCGGQFGELYLDKCYNYTVGDSEDWSSSRSMIHAKAYFTMTAVNSMVITIGGRDTNRLSSVEVFENGEWKEMINWKLSKPRSHHCAVKYGQNSLVITGGFSDGTGVLSSVTQLDTITGEWTTLASMNYKRYLHACTSYSLDSIEYIVIAGGYIEIGYYFSNVERYSSATNEWLNLPSLNTARAYFSIALMNGRLTIMGGKNEESFLASTEYLNGTLWVPGKDLKNPRSGFGSVALKCY